MEQKAVQRTLNQDFLAAILDAGEKHGLNVEQALKASFLMAANSIVEVDGKDELVRLLGEITTKNQTHSHLHQTPLHRRS